MRRSTVALTASSYQIVRFALYQDVTNPFSQQASLRFVIPVRQRDAG
jgi:hypothetical protein